MAKSLQVTVTNPDDLNTLQGELVTQNYNLEILGLKNPADFRKFSKSLMILDRILKETNDKVDNGLKTKLDKGSYEGDAQSLKDEIDGKEPAFSKKSGFNKEKTDDYNGNDTNKLFTQKGANDLYKEVENKVSKDGDTMTGDIYFETGGKGVKFPSTSVGSATINTSSGESKIRGGYDYSGLNYINNVDITTWYGFSVSSCNTSNLGEVVFTINARSGNAQLKNEFVCKKVVTTDLVTNDSSLRTKDKNVIKAVNELLDTKTKYINLSNQAQTRSYVKTVIALCELKDGASTSNNSYSAGTITFHRLNGLEGASIIRADVSIEDRYGGRESMGRANGSLMLSGVDSVLSEVKLCTFIYKGKKYGGLHFYVSEPQHEMVEFYGNTNFEIFAVDYMSVDPSQYPLPSGDVEEIKNSLNFTDVSSDVNRIYYNGSRILTEKTDVIWEIIYNGDTHFGTFTTSKSIWNYNYIQIIGSSDESTYIWVSEHRIKDMRYCLENWKGKWFLLENGTFYWGIDPSNLLADGRTFYAHSSENCRIYQVRVR